MFPLPDVRLYLVSSCFSNSLIKTCYHNIVEVERQMQLCVSKKHPSPQKCPWLTLYSNCCFTFPHNEVNRSIMAKVMRWLSKLSLYNDITILDIFLLLGFSSSQTSEYPSCSTPWCLSCTLRALFHVLRPWWTAVSPLRTGYRVRQNSYTILVIVARQIRHRMTVIRFSELCFVSSIWGQSSLSTFGSVMFMIQCQLDNHCSLTSRRPVPAFLPCWSARINVWAVILM